VTDRRRTEMLKQYRAVSMLTRDINERFNFLTWVVECSCHALPIYSLTYRDSRHSAVLSVSCLSVCVIWACFSNKSNDSLWLSMASRMSSHHSHPPSHIRYFIPGSKLTFSTNLFHHNPLAPTWTAFSDYTGPDLFCSTVFIFSCFSFFFILSCVVD